MSEDRTLSTLRQAALHDPENALYDYLAAFYLDDPDRMEPGWAGLGETRDEADLEAHGDWFRQRMSRVATLPFVRDVGEIELFGRRCLNRLPVSPTERRVIAAKLFPEPASPGLLLHLINCLSESASGNPADEQESCWAEFRRTLDFDDLRRQFENQDPPSPHLDQRLRSMEAAWLLRSAEESDDSERDILLAQSEVSNSKL